MGRIGAVGDATKAQRASVLHVTEAYGGGITTALDQFVSSTPEFDHHLLYVERSMYRTNDSAVKTFVTQQRLERSVTSLIRGYKGALALLRPSIVHVHCPVAGAFVAALGRDKDIFYMYSPHSFIHERTTIPTALRRLVRQMEGHLIRKYDHIVAVSPNEQLIGKSLGAKASYVPNAVSLSTMQVKMAEELAGQDTIPTVVMIGRLSPQKDPSFFLDVALQVKRTLPETAFIWIGDGDKKQRRALTSRGVVVTGWRPRAEVLKLLCTASVYLHSAAWEGSPFSLLEAASMGVPCIVRSIPSTQSIGFPSNVITPSEAAKKVIDHLEGDANAIAEERQARSRVLADANPEEQRRSLSAAYDLALRPNHILLEDGGIGMEDSPDRNNMMRIAGDRVS